MFANFEFSILIIGLLYMIKSKVLFILFLIGLFVMAFGYTKSNLNCGPPLIEYRYIPLDFKSEQANAVDIDSIFHGMFEGDLDSYFNSFILPINIEKSSNRIIKGQAGAMTGSDNSL